MFGVAVARIDALTDAERERYQSLYCGLCIELKRRYGQVSRAALSYDLAFLVMLYDSLYEPPEESGSMHCAAHPRKRIPYSVSEFSSYCADLSVALAFHKCLDDVADDRSARAQIAQSALRRPYRKAKERIPEQCWAICEAMRTIREIELDPASGPDDAAIAFGELLGFLVECVPGRFPDIWSERLCEFGTWLGRFVYLMDAAVDFAQDEKSGSYNPFVRLSPEPHPAEMRNVLSVVANRMCDAFERLPLVQDAHLMHSVLYSGVWGRFNQVYDSALPGRSSDNG